MATAYACACVCADAQCLSIIIVKYVIRCAEKYAMGVTMPPSVQLEPVVVGADIGAVVVDVVVRPCVVQYY